jgi:hypothetical protein
MVFVGLLVTIAGFLIALFSLAATASAGGRLALVCLGIAVSLFGILGIINRAYLRNPIWKR